MARDALIHALRHVAMLDGLSPLQVTEIAYRADRIVFKTGSIITTALQPADAAIVIVSGTAEQITGPGLKANTQLLPPGTIIADMAMLVETTPTSTVVAATEVRALRIGRKDLLQLMAEDPSLAQHFITKAAGRLRNIASQMRQIEQGLRLALTAGPQPAALPSAPSAPPTHH